MANVKITQVRSKIGGTQKQRENLRSLGLGRIGKSVIREDRPEVRGQLKHIQHLVKVEEVTQ